MKTLVTMAAVFAGHAAFAQAPAREKAYSLSFKNEPWPSALEWVAKQSGLSYIATIKPKGTLTLATERPVTLPAVFDLLDKELEGQDLTILRLSQTFLVCRWDAVPPEAIPKITIDELPKRGESERVQVLLFVDGGQAEDTAARLKPLLSKAGSIVAFTPGEVIVQDKAKHVRAIVAALKAPDDGTRAAKPEKMFSVDFKDVPWASVFEWYAKETGMKADLKVKVPGTLTIQTPPGKAYTAAETADLLNEALSQKGYWISLRGGSFVVGKLVDAVEKPSKMAAPAPPPLMVCPPVIYYECHPQPRMRLFGRCR